MKRLLTAVFVNGVSRGTGVLCLGGIGTPSYEDVLPILSAFVAPDDMVAYHIHYLDSALCYTTRRGGASELGEQCYYSHRSFASRRDVRYRKNNRDVSLNTLISIRAQHFMTSSEKESLKTRVENSVRNVTKRSGITSSMDRTDKEHEE